MQQLTLQFDGFADSQYPVNAGTTKQCNSDALSGLLVKCVSFINQKKEDLKTLAAGFIAVFSGFALMFLAAILEG